MPFYHRFSHDVFDDRISGYPGVGQAGPFRTWDKGQNIHGYPGQCHMGSEFQWQNGCLTSDPVPEKPRCCLPTVRPVCGCGVPRATIKGYVAWTGIIEGDGIPETSSLKYHANESGILCGCGVPMCYYPRINAECIMCGCGVPSATVVSGPVVAGPMCGCGVPSATVTHSGPATHILCGCGFSFASVSWTTPLMTNPVRLIVTGQSLEQGWDESSYPNETQPLYGGSATPPTVSDPLYGTLTFAWDGVRWTVTAPDGLQWVWQPNFQKPLPPWKGLLSASGIGAAPNYAVAVLQVPYPVVGMPNTGQWLFNSSGTTRVAGASVYLTAQP